MFLSSSQVLYPGSPFLPPIETQSLFRLMVLTSQKGYHPTLAVAHEIRYIVDEHCQFLDTQADWIAQNFPITDDETDTYYFGLFLPPTLILAADMARFLSVKETLDTLIPADDDHLFDDLRQYISRHLKSARQLLDLESHLPKVTFEGIYHHCAFEVYSDSFWYLTGLQASQYLYSNLARLFNPQFAPL